MNNYAGLTIYSNNPQVEQRLVETKQELVEMKAHVKKTEKELKMLASNNQNTVSHQKPFLSFHTMISTNRRFMDFGFEFKIDRNQCICELKFRGYPIRLFCNFGLAVIQLPS